VEKVESDHIVSLARAAWTAFTEWTFPQVDEWQEPEPRLFLFFDIEILLDTGITFRVVQELLLASPSRSREPGTLLICILILLGFFSWILFRLLLMDSL
jgi:hypothetical protein